MKKVRKAIIPAAGLGTRVLPASKAVPKEMLNIVDKPAIQYIVEEAFESGIEEVLIITNRGKGAIEDHFDHAFELESKLEGQPGKEKILDSVKNCSKFGNIYFLRQKETGGLGHAVLCAKTFVGDEPFAILYGDDVIDAEYPVTKQLTDVYEKFGNGVVGVQEVPREDVPKYCTLDVTPLEKNVMQVHDMLEKPSLSEIMSCYSILGRVVMPPEIFGIIENTPPVNGEVGFTAAMNTLAKQGRLNAVDFIGNRFDMGNKLGILKANCEMGLRHPELKDDFKAYLKELVSKL